MAGVNAPFAGRLRHRVCFETPVYKDSPTGGVKIERWAPAKKVWALVRGVRGDEAILADQRLSTVTHMIEMRYCEDLEDDMSVVIPGDKRLDILDAFDPDGTRERLHVMAEDRGGSA